MLSSTSKLSSNRHSLASAETCPKCAGFTVPSEEGARCINCGWRGCPATRKVSSDKPHLSAPDTAQPSYNCNLDQKHGKVSVHAYIGKTYRVSLSGHRDAFNRWCHLKRVAIENRLFQLLLNSTRAGKRRDRGLQVSASLDTVDLLKKTAPVRTKNFLGNMFAYPFSHGYLRDRAPRGVSESPARILFWQTARDISGPLQCWLKNRGRSEPSYVKLHRLVFTKCGRVTDHLILRYLIDLNWRNAGRDFPDKAAIENRQTLSNLKPKPDAQLKEEYVHSRGWSHGGPDSDVRDRLFSAIGHSRHPLPSTEGGRVLAHGILTGHYIVRARSLVKVSLSPGL